MSGYDVVVVGARPAGAATALLLSRAGLRVLVVDRSSPGADTVSTHALMRGAVMQLARWGLLGQVAATTPPVHGCVFRFGADHLDETVVRDSLGVLLKHQDDILKAGAKLDLDAV